MNIDAVFVGKKIPNALTIPTVAITTHQGEIGVMLLDKSNQAQFKPVKVGFSQDGQTQIIQGLGAAIAYLSIFPLDKLL
ncbi:MAG: hypothetical protein HC930_02740 [Hydrococcus sp. SU_1_0]|nr:hypothetical protein [Hydrococcus sp. SU_1_0]